MTERQPAVPDTLAAELSPRERGFSLTEVMVVLFVVGIAASLAFMSLLPALRQNRVTTAHNAVLMTVRGAREQAVAERRIYIVTFVAPQTMTVTQGATGIVTSTTALPPDITFDNEPGIPTTVTTTPDGFGTGANAIDFDIGVGGGGLTTVYFYPDGSSRDAVGRINSGVVYLARAGELTSSRAVTVAGNSGRIRGWRLYKNPSAGTYYWRQQ